MHVNTTAVRPHQGKAAAADAESRVANTVCGGEAKDTLHLLQAFLRKLFEHAFFVGVATAQFRHRYLGATL